MSHERHSQPGTALLLWLILCTGMAVPGRESISFTYKHTNMPTCQHTVQLFKHTTMQKCKRASLQTCKHTNVQRQNMQARKIQTFKRSNIQTYIHYTTIDDNTLHCTTLHYLTLPCITLHHFTSYPQYSSSRLNISSKELNQKKEHKEPLNCPCPFSFPSDNKQRHGREENGLGVPEMRMRQSPP